MFNKVYFEIPLQSLLNSTNENRKKSVAENKINNYPLWMKSTVIEKTECDYTQIK